MKRERGSATVVVLVLLSLLMVLVVANGHALRHLRWELNRLDRQQQERFQKPGY